VIDYSLVSVWTVQLNLNCDLVQCVYSVIFIQPHSSTLTPRSLLVLHTLSSQPREIGSKRSSYIILPEHPTSWSTHLSDVHHHSLLSGCVHPWDMLLHVWIADYYWIIKTVTLLPLVQVLSQTSCLIPPFAWVRLKSTLVYFLLYLLLLHLFDL
jgi:hypothetical protein